MTSIPSIALNATAVKTAQLHNQIGVAVAKKQQETAKQSGEAAVELIRAAANTAKPQVDFHA